MKIKVNNPAIYKKAVELTLLFADENDIPKSFIRREADRINNIDIFSKVGRRFLKHILAWIETVQSLLGNLDDKKQAWRFINITPSVDSATSVSECQDFVDFTEFLKKRRDEDYCGPDETGGLSMLHSEFQREVERIISSSKSVAS